MKLLSELFLKIDGENKSILFGIPNSQGEMEKMFLLRQEVYKRNNYISTESDKDEYDKDGKSTYFIAKIGDDVIGTVRLIKDIPLPTQKECFDFQEPKEMKEISLINRAELSRLISIPYKGKIYLPRHLILLFLIDCICEYAQQKDILGGYSFITSKLYDKMTKIRIPFHIVKNFKQKYPPTGLMYPYFNKKDNQIVPIYYKLDEIKGYLENLFKNKRMFEKIGENKIRLKDNLYNRFLKFLKII